MKIHSIFRSIDGEVNASGQGCLTTFVRLQGCNMRCPACDTPDSQDVNGGHEKMASSVMEEITNLGLDKVTITGGEPMMQWSKGLETLIRELKKRGLKVSVETNGTYYLPVKTGVNWIVDWKMPGVIGDSDFLNPPMAILNLKETDWIKVVVADREDLNMFLNRIYPKRHALSKARWAISPIFGGELTPHSVLNKMISAKLRNVSLNIQLHKFIKVP